MKPELIDVDPFGSRNIRIKHIDAKALISSFHFHEMCELVWIEKSHGKRIVGDHIGNFDDNDLVLMGPNLPHIWQNDRIYTDDKDGEVKATVIYFPPNILTPLTGDQNLIIHTQDLIERAGRGLIFSAETNERIRHILLRLSTENSFDKILSVLKIINLLAQATDYEFLSSIAFLNRYDEKDSNRISKVYKFLMQNFHRDIDLQEVAEICNMTTNSFCRFFKARTQKPFTQFINEIRIGHSCKLLQDLNYSVTEICYASGYNNLTNFNKFFKQIKGMRPLEYRKKLRLDILDKT